MKNGTITLIASFLGLAVLIGLVWYSRKMALDYTEADGSKPADIQDFAPTYTPRPAPSRNPIQTTVAGAPIAPGAGGPVPVTVVNASNR
jgi:hypothetical protein